MRLMKMLGLAAMTALAAMAFLGASSASATFNTALCKTAESPCAAGNQVTELHTTLTPGTIALLKGENPETNVLCLSVLALGEVLGLAEAPEQQEVHLSKLDFTQCGVEGTGSHSNCTVNVLASTLPLLVSVLNKGELKGTATSLNGLTFVKCVVFGFIKIECEYEGAGLEFGLESANAELNGMLNAAGTLPKVAGGSSCPEKSTITQGLLEPLTKVYVES